MLVETCQVGCALRLGDNTQIVIHRRQGERVGIEAIAVLGTHLLLGGARVRPLSETVGVWTYFFSLQALRRFTLGRFEVRIWFPGEYISHAADCADCADWLHIGISTLPTPLFTAALNRREYARPLPAPVTPARPLLQVEDDGGRLFFGSA